MAFLHTSHPLSWESWFKQFPSSQVDFFWHDCFGSLYKKLVTPFSTFISIFLPLLHQTTPFTLYTSFCFIKVWIGAPKGGIIYKKGSPLVLWYHICKTIGVYKEQNWGCITAPCGRPCGTIFSILRVPLYFTLPVLSWFTSWIMTEFLWGSHQFE